MLLDYCINELSSIIYELRNIQLEVRTDFLNIGQNLCADCIENIADKYEGVLKRLKRVDLNRAEGGS